MHWNFNNGRECNGYVYLTLYLVRFELHIDGWVVVVVHEYDVARVTWSGGHGYC